MIIVQLDSEQLINLIQCSVRTVLKESLSQNPEPIEQSEKLLSVQQAADFLNLTPPTIYTKVSRGELPVMKQGKRLYFSSVELIEYLKAGRKKSYAEAQAEADRYFKK